MSFLSKEAQIKIKKVIDETPLSSGEIRRIKGLGGLQLTFSATEVGKDYLLFGTLEFNGVEYTVYDKTPAA
ncbi:MAG: hypothetical protein ACI9BF_000860 [Candidatus Paceibacteria bacterium]|jgi:hypothetical protein